MSDPLNSEPRKRWRLGRVFLWGFCAFFSLYVFLILAGRTLVEMLLVLPFGWVGFSKRVLSEIRVNWDLLGMALLCLTVGGVILHQFLRWVGGYVAKARGSTFVWPVRWTVCGLMLMGLFFVIGTTVSGVKQQVEWIRQSDAPKTVLRSPSLASSMKMLAMEMSFEMEENGIASYKNLQTKFRSINGFSIYSDYRPPIKHFHGLAIFEGEKCVCLVIFPRDEAVRAKYGSYYLTANDKQWLDERKLKEVLAKHRDNLRSL